MDLIFQNHTDAKSAMGDVMDMYVYHPLSLFVVHRVRLVDVEWITPNMVSLAHFICAILCMVFLTQERRKLAICIFVTGLWLDCVDGDLARARVGQTGFTNNYESWGYVLEVVKDGACGILLLYGIFNYIQKKRGHPLVVISLGHLSGDVESNHKPLKHTEIETPQSPNSQRRRAFYGVLGIPVRTGDTIALLFALLVAQIFLRAIIWDNSVRLYHDLLETKMLAPTDNCPDPTKLDATQRGAFEMGALQFVFWLWRLSSAQAVYDILLLAVWFDRLELFLLVCARVGWIQLLGVVTVTGVHYFTLRDVLEQQFAMLCKA